MSPFCITFFQILENWGLHFHLLAPSFHVNDEGIYDAAGPFRFETGL